MSSKLIAIIAGVGPGTGAALARKFAASYPVALLARNPDNFNGLVEEINSSGGKAFGVSTDVGDNKSVTAAFEAIKKEYGEDVGVAAAVFNASGPFARKPFLELTQEQFEASAQVSLYVQTPTPFLYIG